jgi:hypothetical protein
MHRPRVIRALADASLIIFVRRAMNDPRTLPMSTCVRLLTHDKTDTHSRTRPPLEASMTSCAHCSRRIRRWCGVGRDIALMHTNVCSDKRQCTPLHHAVWTGQYDCVQLLIRVDDERALNTSIINEMDLLVNLTNNCGDTPLHLAAQTVGVRVVAALLHVRMCVCASARVHCAQARANVHMRNARAETALDIAARHGRTQVCRILINHSPTLVLHAAVQARQTAVDGSTSSATSTRRQQVPLSRTASTQSQCTSTIYPLHAAARNGHTETCALLVDTAGFDINFVTESGSALHAAALHGRVDVVRLLLKKGECTRTCSHGVRRVCRH